MEPELKLKQQLLEYLEGGHAHKTLNEAVAGFPVKLINGKPENAPYTFWQLLEHIRITQKDILNFIQNPNYVYLDWPKDYWLEESKNADKEIWDQTIEYIIQDAKTLKKIIKDTKTELLTRIPHGEGQTILREVLLVIDHNSYHLGEFILMRRIMNIWPANQQAK